MADRALEAAVTNDKGVVITFADFFQPSRDYLLDCLKKGGAQNVTLLFLTMDEDKKLEAIYNRTKQAAEQAGCTLGDFCKAGGFWHSDGDPTLEDFRILIKTGGNKDSKGEIPFEGPPPYAKIVDVTGRDITQLDGVDAALGLHRSNEESYEEIVKKVLA